jgi:ribosomal protein S14
VTALSILAQATAAGLTLRPCGDKIRFKPAARLTPELKAAMVENKQEVLDLLRAGRVAEIRAFYGQAFVRLSGMYPDSLLGDLWLIVSREHPSLATSIERAEYAADASALAFQRGDDVDSSAFLAYLRTWEAAWREAIALVTASTDRCSDCGRTDATIMVTTDTGRFCRRCLRPAPLNSPPKGARRDA